MEHVGTPKVHRPGDVVQARKKRGCGFLFRKVLTDFSEFLSNGFLCRREDAHGSGGARRAFRPKVVDQIFRVFDRYGFRGHLGFQVFQTFRGDGCEVHAHVRVVCEIHREPCPRRRHVFFPRLHDGDAGARGFARGLIPIAAVRPEKGFVRRHDEGAGRPREPREVAAKRPVFGEIFTHVRVACGNDEGRQIAVGESLSHGGQAFGNRCRHKDLLNFWCRSSNKWERRLGVSLEEFLASE